MSAGSKSASPARAGIAVNARPRIIHVQELRRDCRDIGVALAALCSDQRRKKLRRRYTKTSITASGTAQPIQTGGDQRRVSGSASRLIADAPRNKLPIQPYQYIGSPDFAGLVSHSHSLMRG